MALGMPALLSAQQSTAPLYSWTPRFTAFFPADLDSYDARVRTTRTGLDVGGLWQLDERWKLGLEGTWENSHYKFHRFDKVLPLMDQPLRDAFTISLSPTAIYGINEKWSLIGSSTLSFNGDPYASFGDSLIFSGYAGARRQFSERFALTLGLFASSRIEEDMRVLPLIGVEWQISRRWRLGVQGAGGQLSYSITDPSRTSNSLRAFARMAFDLRDFRLDKDSPIPDGVLRDESFPVSLGLEWQPSPAATVVLQAGSAFGRSIELADRHGHALAESDTTGSTFISLAVKVGFPGQRTPDASGSGPGTPSTDRNIQGTDGCCQGPVLQLWEENDSVTGTDHDYTQGLRVTWLAREHAPKESPIWLRWFAEDFPSFGYEVDRARGSLTLGQSIYTPGDISVKQLQPNDRPYAGWIYGVPAVQRRGLTEGGTPVLEEVRLELGWIGPGALGGEAQNFIHRNFHINQAQGWENQLHNEPTAALGVARAWRIHLGGDRDGGAVEWIPHVALTGGTPRTQAAVGGTLRAGVRLPDDFGQPTIHSGLPSSGGGPTEGFGVHLFAAIEARAVARDSMVDGNLWRESHRQDSQPWGLEGRLGVVATWRRFDLGFTYTYESRDYDLQPHNHDYGSVWLNWRI